MFYQNFLSIFKTTQYIFILFAFTLICFKSRTHRDSDDHNPDLTCEFKVKVGSTETTLLNPFDWRRKSTPKIVPVIPLAAEDITFDYYENTRDGSLFMSPLELIIGQIKTQ